MTAISRAFLLTLYALGCSSVPTGPLTQSDPTASAEPSSGVQLRVETMGSNLPTQLKFFVCSDSRTQSKSVELSFLCRFTASAFGTLRPNADFMTRIAAGVWRAGLELPANCRPNPPFAEFYNHTVVGQRLTVIENAVTPTMFSINCQ